jgi:hypothetical protein
MLTISRIKYENKAAGKFWFSPDTLRFFRSRISDFVVQDSSNKDLYYFISSEQYDDNSPRLYSVRVFNYDTKNIDTVGEFQEYETITQAKAAAKRIAAGN